MTCRGSGERMPRGTVDSSPQPSQTLEQSSSTRCGVQVAHIWYTVAQVVGSPSHPQSLGPLMAQSMNQSGRRTRFPVKFDEGSQSPSTSDPNKYCSPSSFMIISAQRFN